MASGGPACYACGMRLHPGTVLATAVVTLILVLLGAGAGLLALAARPSDVERVVALGNRPAWTVTVTYRPAEPRADVEVRMDGLRRHRDVAFRVEAPEPWAPRWQGRLQGELSDFVSLRDAAGPPVPLDPAAAKALAAGYRLVLTVDGEPLTVAFDCCARPAPPPGMLEAWRHRLCSPIRLVG